MAISWTCEAGTPRRSSSAANSAKVSLVLARSEEQQPGDLGGTSAAIRLLAADFEEYRAVFVSLAGGGFVAAKPFKRAPVGIQPGLVDPGADQVDSRTKMRPSSKWISDVTVAEMLKEAGYRTGFVGKWGLGLPGSTGAPHKQGFDLAYGFYDQHARPRLFPQLHDAQRRGREPPGEPRVQHEAPLSIRSPSGRQPRRCREPV